MSAPTPAGDAGERLEQRVTELERRVMVLLETLGTAARAIARLNDAVENIETYLRDETTEKGPSDADA